jgi:hypothetical protein
MKQLKTRRELKMADDFADLPSRAQQSTHALLEYLGYGNPSQRDPYYALAGCFVHCLIFAVSPTTGRAFIAQLNALLGAHDRVRIGTRLRAPPFAASFSPSRRSEATAPWNNHNTSGNADDAEDYFEFNGHARLRRMG